MISGLRDANTSHPQPIRPPPRRSRANADERLPAATKPASGQPLPAHSAAAAPELLKAYPDQLMKEPIAMGVRKGDADTLNFLNNWIEVTRSKGWIDERYTYWFASTEWQQRVQ